MHQSKIATTLDLSKPNLWRLFIYFVVITNHPFVDFQDQLSQKIEPLEPIEPNTHLECSSQRRLLARDDSLKTLRS